MKLLKKSNKDNQNCLNLQFHNLSSNTELNKLKHLLGKGLKYIPLPQDIHSEEIFESFKTFSRLIRIHHFFRNKPDRSYDPRLKLKPSSWEPPDSQVIVGRINDLKLSIQNILWEIPPTRRKQSSDIKILEELRDDPNIIITQTDKNLGFAALDTIQYHKLALNHLNDSTNYKLIGTSANYLLQSRMTRLEQVMLECQTLKQEMFQKVHGHLSTQQRKFLTEPFEAELPQFHILPKVHKKELAGRPIVGAKNWINTKASKILNIFLEPHVQRHDHILKNSDQLCQRLSEIGEINPNWLLVSFDIVSLYPNILQSYLLECMPNQETKLLLEFVLDTTYFTYCGKIFKQISGIPMGTNAAVNLANLYLYHHTDRHMLRNPKVKHYFRYIDDLFFFWDGTFQDLRIFKDQMNDVWYNLKYTCEVDYYSINVLDITIHKNRHGLISFSPYTKTTNKFLYLLKSSNHPPSVFKGIVLGEFIRLARHTTTALEYSLHVSTSIKRFKRRGYSSHFLQKMLKLVPWSRRFQSKPIETKKVAPLILKYTKRPIYHRIGKAIKNTVIPNSKMILAYKRTRNMENILCRSSLSPNKVNVIQNHFGRDCGFIRQRRTE